MRTFTALTLAAAIGLGASLYTPAAKAGGVYIGVGLPVPVVGACVAPGYYGAVCPGPFVGYAGWGGWGGYGYGGYWGRGPGLYGRPGFYGGGHYGGGHFAGGHYGGGHWGGGVGSHGSGGHR